MAGGGVFESNRSPVLAREETLPLVTLARAPYLPPRCSRSSLKLMHSHSAPDRARYSPLSSKYAVTQVAKDAKMRKVTAVYGTMPVVLTNNNDDHDRPEQDDEEDPVLVAKTGKHSPLSNQSETESDSDGSSSTGTNPAALLQSILRIRPDGLAACRTTKKQASVEFVLDIDDDDDCNPASHRNKKSRDSRFSACAARCMPR